MLKPLTRLVALAAVGACSSSSSSSPPPSQGEAIPACGIPMGADTTSDGSTKGCHPQSAFQVCQVPPGSTLDPSGNVTAPDGGKASCQWACTATQYTLTCTGTSPADIPPPGGSLGCEAIRVPTPSNALFYCCPCGA